MDLPDCMEVCSFSTTSPSWIRSCLTLMPVISSNALASVLDSYSCVVMVSDTTEISFTPLAWSFLAASMNHFISAICWSLFSVDGWNSLSIHFLASASPAQAACPIARAAAAKAIALNCIFIAVSSQIETPIGRPAPTRGGTRPGLRHYKNNSYKCLPIKRKQPFFSLTLAHDQRQQRHRHHKADPDRRVALQAEPLGQLAADAHKDQVHVGGRQQPDKKPVAARGLQGQETLAHGCGRLELPHRHAHQHQHDARKEHCHRQRPGHPVKHVAASSNPAHRETLRDVVPHKPDHDG